MYNILHIYISSSIIEMQEIKQRDNLKLHNTFIEAKSDKLSKDEQNFLYLMISQINTDDTQFKQIKIHIQDIEKFAFVKKNYKQVKDFIVSLSRKGISYYENNKFCRRSLFYRLNYIEDSGYIEAALHGDLFDMLLQLRSDKGNFTQASLMSCISFRSKYSSPLYLLLKSVYDKQKIHGDYVFVDYTPEFIMNHFSLPNSYSLYNNLKQKFLEVTRDDISDNSEFNISFEARKKGRPLEYIRFTIYKKEKEKSAKLEDFSLIHDSTDLDIRVCSRFNQSTQKAIIEIGLNGEKLDALISEYQIKDIEEAIYQMNKKDIKNINNKDGYLKAIIINKSK